MDVPTHNEEADRSAAAGSVSDAPAATQPASPSPEARTAVEMPRTPRPTQIRSGVIAAACAIAVVVGVTAVPSLTGSSAGPAAGYAPTATLALEALPMEGALPAFDLGAELGAFDIPGSPSWKDYGDGTAVLSVWFGATSIADAALAGEIRLSKPVDGGDVDDTVLLVDPTVSPSVSDDAFDDGRGYRRIEGELFGRGALDGVMIRIASPPDSTVRRGTWNHSDGTNVRDAVFARFTWTSEGASTRDVAVPAQGDGTLAVALRPAADR